MTSNGSNPVPLADLVEDTIGGLWGDSPDSAEPDNIAVLVIRGADFRHWASHRAANAARRAIPRRLLARRELRLGDLVLEVSGGGPSQPVGRVVVIDGETLDSATHPLIPSNFCRRIRLRPDANPYFVKRQLDLLYRDGYFDQYQTSTTNIRNLQVNAFLDGTVLDLPAPDDQERLTKVADDFDSRTTSVHAHLSLALNYMQRFRQSVLAAACSGHLSRDWRAMHGLDESEAPADDSDLAEGSVPLGWQRAALREVCDAIVDCPHSTPKYGVGERFAIDTNSMSNRGIDLTRLRTVTTEVFNARNRRLEPSPGDIVFAREGTVGTAVELPESPRVCLGQRVMLMRPGQKVLPEFLRLALISPLVRKQYVQKILGTTAPHLNVRDVVTLRLLIPPLDEQSEIVRTVGTLFALTDETTTRIESAFSSSESCMQSFLARIFHVATNGNEAEDSNGSAS